MSEAVCKRCLVSGRVQGVFFRASTAARASELAVTGWARNLRDGRVEVLACGTADDVSRLCTWLWSGPEMASVTGVIVEDAHCAPPDSFTTG